jgi:hypothetical protein
MSIVHPAELLDMAKPGLRPKAVPVLQASGVFEGTIDGQGRPINLRVRSGRFHGFLILPDGGCRTTTWRRLTAP